MTPEGVWLPVVTPFLHEDVDYDAYQRLLRFYLSKGIAGFIPLGTTGECPVITEDEFEKLIATTVEVVQGEVPLFIGTGGNDTRKVIKMVKTVEKYPVSGILSVCPYYNRPGQDGMLKHFTAISESTDLDIIVYNIPYRTGVNLLNETLFKLAEHKNIVGVKDSCSIIRQSLELLAQKPKDFSVLTGEDLLFYTMLVNGGEGGITASAHLHTEAFIDIYKAIKANDHLTALETWRRICGIVPLLFEEPNPGPIKYLLHRKGRLGSDAVRLPLTGISDQLKQKLDQWCAQSGG